MNKSEQLIACLEGEIAKRDEELAACRVAVENCEVFRARIAELEHRCGMYGLELTNEVERRLQAERQLSALKAQEPVEYQLRALIRDVTNIPEAGYYMPQSWHDQVIALSLSGKLDAPVSEAKAQGVVQWPDADEIMQMAFEEGQQADDASGYCFELEEFDLFIERLMSEVARLNATHVQQVSVPDGLKLVPVEPTGAMLGAAFDGTGESEAMRVRVNLRFLNAYRAMLNAATTAPAADAVASLIEWTKDAVEWGGALNYAAWEFVNECPEKSALLFNNTKGPLRAAIMKYAEIVSANAKDSSHE